MNPVYITRNNHYDDHYSEDVDKRIIGYGNSIVYEMLYEHVPTIPKEEEKKQEEFFDILQLL